MTILILVLTILISLIAFYRRDIDDRLKFNAYVTYTHNEWWRFISYGFVHGDYIHLLVNMYVLFSFGSFVESRYMYWFDEKGLFYFTILYLGGLLVSITPDYLKHKHNAFYNAVGASGAVSAIVFAFMVFEPAAKMGILFLPFQIPAIIFGVLYLGYSYYMDKKAVDNIGHGAHFWGAIFGFIFTLVLKPSLFLLFISQVKYLIP